eukprot:GHVN01107111.1.p1 GENE.GHVN01107111.1~~GHVN01107111.1.p1  ORF type:complete len:1987 (+),score=425.03 GHVN01107111.1:314-6274(+)
MTEASAAAMSGNDERSNMASTRSTPLNPNAMEFVPFGDLASGSDPNGNPNTYHYHPSIPHRELIAGYRPAHGNFSQTAPPHNAPPNAGNPPHGARPAAAQAGEPNGAPPLHEGPMHPISLQPMNGFIGSTVLGQPLLAPHLQLHFGYPLQPRPMPNSPPPLPQYVGRNPRGVQGGGGVARWYAQGGQMGGNYGPAHGQGGGRWPNQRGGRGGMQGAVRWNPERGGRGGSRRTERASWRSSPEGQAGTDASPPPPNAQSTSHSTHTPPPSQRTHTHSPPSPPKSYQAPHPRTRPPPPPPDSPRVPPSSASSTSPSSMTHPEHTEGACEVVRDRSGTPEAAESVCESAPATTSSTTASQQLSSTVVTPLKHSDDGEEAVVEVKEPLVSKVKEDQEETNEGAKVALMSAEVKHAVSKETAGAAGPEVPTKSLTWAERVKAGPSHPPPPKPTPAPQVTTPQPPRGGSAAQRDPRGGRGRGGQGRGGYRGGQRFGAAETREGSDLRRTGDSTDMRRGGSGFRGGRRGGYEARGGETRRETSRGLTWEKHRRGSGMSEEETKEELVGETALGESSAGEAPTPKASKTIAARYAQAKQRSITPPPPSTTPPPPAQTPLTTVETEGCTSLDPQPILQDKPKLTILVAPTSRTQTETLAVSTPKATSPTATPHTPTTPGKLSFLQAALKPAAPRPPPPPVVPSPNERMRQPQTEANTNKPRGGGAGRGWGRGRGGPVHSDGNDGSQQRNGGSNPINQRHQRGPRNQMPQPQPQPTQPALEPQQPATAQVAPQDQPKTNAEATTHSTLPAAAAQPAQTVQAAQPVQPSQATPNSARPPPPVWPRYRSTPQAAKASGNEAKKGVEEALEKTNAGKIDKAELAAKTVTPEHSEQVTENKGKVDLTENVGKTDTSEQVENSRTADSRNPIQDTMEKVEKVEKGTNLESTQNGWITCVKAVEKVEKIEKVEQVVKLHQSGEVGGSAQTETPKKLWADMVNNKGKTDKGDTAQKAVLSDTPNGLEKVVPTDNAEPTGKTFKVNNDLTDLTDPQAVTRPQTVSPSAPSLSSAGSNSSEKTSPQAHLGDVSDVGRTGAELTVNIRSEPIEKPVKNDSGIVTDPNAAKKPSEGKVGAVKEKVIEMRVAADLDEVQGEVNVQQSEVEHRKSEVSEVQVNSEVLVKPKENDVSEVSEVSEARKSASDVVSETVEKVEIKEAVASEISETKAHPMSLPRLSEVSLIPSAMDETAVVSPQRGNDEVEPVSDAALSDVVPPKEIASTASDADGAIYSIRQLLMIREKQSRTSESHKGGLTLVSEASADAGETDESRHWRGGSPSSKKGHGGWGGELRVGGMGMGRISGGGRHNNFKSLFDQPPTRPGGQGAQPNGGYGVSDLNDWRPTDSGRGVERSQVRNDGGTTMVRREDKTPSFLMKFQSEDSINATRNKMRQLLNKLCEEKFDALYEKLVPLIDGNDSIQTAVELIWTFSVKQHNHMEMYGRMCSKLHKHLEELKKAAEAAGEKSDLEDFRVLLISKCQVKFEEMLREDDYKPDETLSADDAFAAHLAYKGICNGNNMFFAELFKNSLLSSTIMLKCMEQLTMVNGEHLTESLFHLLKSAAPRFDLFSKSSKQKDRFAAVMVKVGEKIVELEQMEGDSLRLSLLMKNLMEDRADHWARALRTDHQLRADYDKLSQEEKKQNGPKAVKTGHEGGWTQAPPRRNQQAGRNQMHNDTNFHTTTAPRQTPHHAPPQPAYSTYSTNNRFGTAQASRNTDDHHHHRRNDKADKEMKRQANPDLDSIHLTPMSLSLGGSLKPSNPSSASPRRSFDPPQPASSSEKAQTNADIEPSGASEVSAAAVEFESSETPLPSEWQSTIDQIMKNILFGEADVDDGAQQLKKACFPLEFSPHLFSSSLVYITERSTPIQQRTVSSWVMAVLRENVLTQEAFSLGVCWFSERAAEFKLDAPLLPEVIKKTVIPTWQRDDSERRFFTPDVEKTLVDGLATC